jgi:hypothetical protein
MLDEWLTDWFRWLGGTPCFQIHARARHEPSWRIVDVFATARRNLTSPWPLWAGTCTTWSAAVISVGWDFAEAVIAEEARSPHSREFPQRVPGGRIHDPARRRAAGTAGPPSASEILAHECGHTWQALRLGPCYLPLVGAVTLFREGPHPWNRFENEASGQGEFGGLVAGSICDELLPRLRAPSPGLIP